MITATSKSIKWASLMILQHLWLEIPLSQIEMGTNKGTKQHEIQITLVQS